MQKDPFASIFISNAFPFVALIIVLCYLINSKKYKLTCPLLLLVRYWGTLILGPVGIIRYTVPFMMAVPIAVLTIFINYKSNKNFMAKRVKPKMRRGKKNE